MTQCRYMLEGSLSIIAAPYHGIAGLRLSNKMAALAALSADDFVDMALEKGFIANVEAFHLYYKTTKRAHFSNTTGRQLNVKCFPTIFSYELAGTNEKTQQNVCLNCFMHL